MTIESYTCSVQNFAVKKIYSSVYLKETDAYCQEINSRN